MPKSSSSNSAPPLFRTSPCGQREPGNLVHALRPQERFEREFDGIFVAAIHQPVVFPAGGIRENRVTALERQDGQV